MNLQLLFLTSLLTLTHAHSWVECINTHIPNYDLAKTNPSTILPTNNCSGFPRNVTNTDWIYESTYYSWNLNHPTTNAHNLACNPFQTPFYPPLKPMTVAKPGDSLTLSMWGNGHVRGDWGLPPNRDPGLVRIYWKGRKEAEITLKSELTELNWVPGAQANFSADAWSVRVDGRPFDKAAYFHLKVPGKIENGRHMMVWAWANERGFLKNKEGWKQGDYDRSWIDVWSTCFDIMITGSDHKGPTYSVEEKKKLAAEIDKIDSGAACRVQSCRKGGNLAYLCKGDDCPPCWYQKPDGIDCYEYLPQTTSCPFGGGFDCKSKKQK